MPPTPAPFVLPPPRTAAPRRNPSSLLLYSHYKVGKTTSIAALPGCLVLELQPRGADHVDHGMIEEVPTCERFLEILAQLKAARDAGRPICRRLAIDHLGILDDWIFELALKKFKLTPMGSGKNSDIRHITHIPSATANSGSPGWHWYWEELSIMHFNMIAAADEVIFLSHVRDKAVTKQTGEIFVEDFDLTGQKGRRLFAGQSSGIGYMYRRRSAILDELLVSFITKDGTAAGCSCPHLSGREFVIGKCNLDAKGNPLGSPVFNWSEVFLEDGAPIPSRPA